MNLEQARVQAYTAVQSAVSTLVPVPPICWPNQPLIDRSNQLDPYIDVAFDVGAAIQMSLGELKVTRNIGQLILLVCVKEGTGLVTTTNIIKTLTPLLGMKNFSGFQTQEASPLRSVTDKGWLHTPLSISFWFDDLL